MSLAVPLLFSPTMLTTGTTTLYTVPSTATTTVLVNAAAHLTNTATSAVSVTMYAVPSGGSPTVTNMCLPSQTMGANSFFDFNVPVIGAGGTLRAVCSANTSVNVQELSGVLYS